MSFLTNLFGSSATAQQPANSPTADDASIALAVSKAVRQLEFVAKNYGFDIGDGNTDDLMHDWQVMLKHNDLNSLRLQLLGHDGLVQMEFKVEFKADATANGKVLDNGNSIELPVISRNLLSGRRVLVNRNGLEATYKHRLRLAWGRADSIDKTQGTEYRSDHAARITGNRQSGSFFVPDAARHRYVICTPGPGPFRFARDLDTGIERIFVDLRHWPIGAPLQVGTTFTAVPVQTKRGIQVRSIRPL